MKNRLFLVSISASPHVQIHAVVSSHAHFSESSLNKMKVSILTTIYVTYLINLEGEGFSPLGPPPPPGSDPESSPMHNPQLHQKEQCFSGLTFTPSEPQQSRTLNPSHSSHSVATCRVVCLPKLCGYQLFCTVQVSLLVINNHWTGLVD